MNASKSRLYILLAALGALAVVVLVLARSRSPQAEPLIGGDKDAHGCLPSAGYSWCEAKKKCLRPWEEACAANGQLQPTPSAPSGTQAPAKDQTCKDNDGGKDYAKASSTCAGGMCLFDRCDGTKTVIEHYCDGNAIKWEKHDCKKSCAKGACV